MTAIQYKLYPLNHLHSSNIAKIKTPTLQYSHELAPLPPEIVCKLQTNILRAEDYNKLKEAVVVLHEKSKRCLIN